jgi:dTDP-4-amino-4,6-dideoxygalactose transaminase/peptidoglycan/LPS O-acetylase OafA/YrhL
MDRLVSATLNEGFLMKNSSANSRSLLALDGGTPVRSGPLSPWPCFDEELIEASSKVLRSNKVNYWTGEEGKLFEREYAAAIGSQHAIALTNGTVALELALYGFGIGPGDEVIVPSRTFIASASCVVMRGATPVVADVDRDSQTLTVDTVRAVMTPRTKAIVAVHLAGWPCDLDPIIELAHANGIKVIEDCAQSHHATYKGRHVGSIGDAGAFSFCQDKIMTTGGEGGLMTTNDTELWDKCWSLKDHGKSQTEMQKPHQPHLFRWLHQNFGTNWRLTEMQSAMGRIMLRRLPQWVGARRKNARTLNASLASVPGLRIPQAPEHSDHSYYKYYAFVRPEYLTADWTRDRIIQNLQAEGIPCGPGSCSEIYLEKAFDGVRPVDRLPVARELGETSLMFMVHPTLTAAEIEATAEAIQKVMFVAGTHGMTRLVVGEVPMRPNNFDLLRLLAAWQVVYCHSCWHLNVTSGIGNPTLAWFVNWFPGVPIFFTISGFLISRSWERTDDWRQYATKRALRIYPALWVQLAVGILLAASFGVITSSVVSGSSFIAWVIAQSTCVQFYNPSFMRSFGLGVLNGSLWTIPVELGFYLSLPLLYGCLVNRVSRRIADGGMAVLSLVSFGYWFYLSTWADPASNWTKLQMVTPLPHLHMFLVGVLLQRNFERVLPYVENRAPLWFAAFATCMLSLNPWGAGVLSTSPVAVLLGRILLAMTVLSFAFSWRSLSERLLRGNDISYGVYLYHGLAINTLVQLGWKGRHEDLAIVALATLLLATLSWWLVEHPAVALKTAVVRPEVAIPVPVVDVSSPPRISNLERRAA